MARRRRPATRRMLAALRRPAATYLAVLGTFATVTPISAAAHLGDSFITLGVGLALLLGRRATEGSVVASIVRLPLVTAGAFGAGYLLRDYRPAYDALFVLAVIAATMSSRLGPRLTAIARSLVAPLLALIVVPAGHLGGPLRTLGWSMVAGMVAIAWVLATMPRAVKTTPTQVRRPAISTLARLATHRALGLTAAFIAGQWLFPAHWTWTVITAYTVVAGTVSRGEVVLKGLQRLGGALAGTALATPLAIALEGHRDAAVASIFVLLGVGLSLRDRWYFAWAASVTGVLALLYGLLGQTASTRLLGERLLEITLGGVLAAIPSCLVFPIRTTSMVHRRTGAALLALRGAFEAAKEDRPHAIRHAEAALDQLRAAAAPLLFAPHARNKPETIRARQLLDARTHVVRYQTDETAVAALRAVHREVGLAFRRAGKD